MTKPLTFIQAIKATSEQRAQQLIFNKVATYLLTRTERAGKTVEDEYGGSIFSCQYRSATGPCAVGYLIPDEVYDTSFEGRPAGEVIRRIPELKPLHEHAALLDALQRIHDQASDVRFEDDIRRGLRAVAEFYELDASVVI